MENISTLLKKIAGADTDLFAVATVSAISSNGETMDVVDLATDVPILDVRLQAVVDGSNMGLLVRPKIGSFVIVAALAKGFRDSVCILFSEIEKISVSIENTTFEIDKNGILANKGENGGLCIVPELKSQLARQTARIDAIYNALINSSTVVNDGGAAYKLGIATALNAVGSKENFENIENLKFKH